MNRFVLVNDKVREKLHEFLDAIEINPKKPLEVVIKIHDKGATARARGYLFKVCYGAICDWSGYETEELHELMKRKFLEPKEIEFEEETILIYSIKGLKSKELAKYTDCVARWAAQQGVYIPQPGEDYSNV